MARITTTVVQVEGDLVSVSFEGETRAAIEGSKKIGYSPKLLGRAKYNLKDQKFVFFESGCDGGRVTVTNATIRIPTNATIRIP